MVIAPPNALIVKEEKAPTTTPGGVELPEKVDRPYHTGIVVDGFMWPPQAYFPRPLGTPRGTTEYPPVCAMDVTDWIVYYRGGFTFTHDGEEYMHVSQHDVIAVARGEEQLALPE